MTLVNEWMQQNNLSSAGDIPDEICWQSLLNVSAITNDIDVKSWCTEGFNKPASENLLTTVNAIHILQHDMTIFSFAELLVSVFSGEVPEDPLTSKIQPSIASDLFGLEDFGLSIDAPSLWDSLQGITPDNLVHSSETFRKLTGKCQDDHDPDQQTYCQQLSNVIGQEIGKNQTFLNQFLQWSYQPEANYDNDLDSPLVPLCSFSSDGFRKPSELFPICKSFKRIRNHANKAHLSHF